MKGSGVALREGGYEAQFVAERAAKGSTKPKRQVGQLTIPISRVIGSPYPGNNSASSDGSKLSLVNCNITSIDKIPAHVSLKVRTLFLSNNNLTSLDGIGQFGNAVIVSAAHNLIRFLDDLSSLSALQHLEKVSLEGNVVVSMPYYREYIVAMCPRLQSLDGVKVTEGERESSISTAHKIASTFEHMRLNELQNCILHHFKGMLRCHVELRAMILGRFRNLRSFHLPTCQDHTPIISNRATLILQALRGGVYQFLRTSHVKEFDRVIQVENLTRTFLNEFFD